MPVKSATKVADPRLAWTRFAAAVLSSGVPHLAADRVGNLYLGSEDLAPPRSGGKLATPGAQAADLAGEPWLLKMTPSGQVAWLRQLGGSGRDVIRDIEVLSNGRLAVALSTSSPDFPGLDPSYQRTGHYSDAVVSVVDPASGNLVWSRALGGVDDDTADGLAAGPNGSVAVTGGTVPTDSPYLPDVDDTLSRAMVVSSVVPFAAVLNADGTTRWFRPVLPRRTTPVGQNTAFGVAVAVGRAGQVVLTGRGTNPELPTTAGSVQPRMTSEHGNQGFVFTFSPAGTLAWGSYLGGRGETVPAAVEVAANGTVAVVGATQAPDFPRMRAVQRLCADGGHNDAFVTRLSADGRRIVHSTCVGGRVGGLALDATTARDGSLVVVGTGGGPGFPTRGRCQNSRAGGAGDAFVATFGRGGPTLNRAFAFGGSDADSGYAIATVPGGIAVAGWTGSLDFPGARPDDPDGPRAVGQTRQAIFLTRFTGL